jgi:hypothetical protein
MSNINQRILISAAVKVSGVLNQHIAFLGENWRAQAFQNGPPARPNLVATGGGLTGWRVIGLRWSCWD